MPSFDHDVLRRRILSRYGLTDLVPVGSIHKTPIEIIDEQVSWDFMAKMAWRMVTGYFRYGPVRENRYDAVGYAKTKIANYEKYGNMEDLVDAASCLMVESVRPLHPNSHFESGDDGVHAKEA